jgi:signal transduction histidine kinase
MEPEALIITVQDKGCGIPADDVDGIFEPFRSSFAKGTGLGLAVVHRIVTDYSGSIQVVSTVGQGTTMNVRLPIRGRVSNVSTLALHRAEPEKAAV